MMNSYSNPDLFPVIATNLRFEMAIARDTIGRLVIRLPVFVLRGRFISCQEIYACRGCHYHDKNNPEELFQIGGQNQGAPQ